MLTVGLGDGSRSHQVPALRGSDTTSCQTNGSCCCRAPTSGQLPNSGSLQQAGEGERSGELKQRGSPVPAQRQNKHWAIPALPRKLGIRTAESPPACVLGVGGSRVPSPASALCQPGGSSPPTAAAGGLAEMGFTRSVLLPSELPAAQSTPLEGKSTPRNSPLCPLHAGQLRRRAQRRPCRSRAEFKAGSMAIYSKGESYAIGLLATKLS